jgi:hypothetical protein
VSNSAIQSKCTRQQEAFLLTYHLVRKALTYHIKLKKQHKTSNTKQATQNNQHKTSNTKQSTQNNQHKTINTKQSTKQSTKPKQKPKPKPKPKHYSPTTNAYVCPWWVQQTKGQE